MPSVEDTIRELDRLDSWRDYERSTERERQAREERRRARRQAADLTSGFDNLLGESRHLLHMRLPDDAPALPEALPYSFDVIVIVRSVEWDSALPLPVFTIYADLLGCKVLGIGEE